MPETNPIEDYIDADGKHRWRATAANGEIVGAASEGFVRAVDSRHNRRVLLALLLEDADLSGQQSVMAIVTALERELGRGESDSVGGNSVGKRLSEKLVKLNEQPELTQRDRLIAGAAVAFAMGFVEGRADYLLDHPPLDS